MLNIAQVASIGFGFYTKFWIRNTHKTSYNRKFKVQLILAALLLDYMVVQFGYY